MTIDIQKARSLMAQKNIDVMLVNSAGNFVYTSGIHDNTMLMLMQSQLLVQFTVIPRESEPVLLINSALIENAEEVSWIKDIRTTPTGAWLVREKKHKDFADNVIEGVRKVLEERKLTSGRVGIEKGYVTLSLYERLREELPDAQFCDIKGIMQNLRAIKTDEEIRKMKKSVEIDEKGYEAAFACISEGISDFDIIREFKEVVAREGGDISHLNYGVGPKGGVMFSQAYGRKAKRGDIIRLDLGTSYMGYRSDLCRIAVLGKPSERLEKLYGALLEAEQRGIKAIKPGVKLRDVYGIIIETVRDAGYAGYTRGMVGHGIGLECEEQPMITATADAVFEPNMVFCVEVPWYEPGWGGVSVEDTIVVTKDGYEELSTMSRELRIIE